VEQRIRLVLDGDERLLAAAQAHEGYIAGETWRPSIATAARTARPRPRASRANSCASRGAGELGVRRVALILAPLAAVAALFVALAVAANAPADFPLFKHAHRTVRAIQATGSGTA